MLGAMKGIEADVDRLYQLPLDAFTSERNALAKRAGADAPRIRELTKPSLPAWAVNQLYWQDRDEWDALISAAENLRRAHKAVLGGRAGDVRAAGKVHDDAIESALKATVKILARSGHPVTDATRQGILNTLRALPSEDSAGRLAKTLQPGGFEMLAGLSIAAGARGGQPSIRRSGEALHPAHERKAPARTRDADVSKSDARALTAARQEAASSERALREAEQAARRDEFEAARAGREELRAADAVSKARDALARAEADVERAEGALAEAKEMREAAEARVPVSRDAAAAAEKRARTGAAALKKLTAG